MPLGTVVFLLIAASTYPDQLSHHSPVHLEKAHGICDTTSFSDAPFSESCERDFKGAWDVRDNQYRLRGIDDCVALCRRCFRCAFVSFSAENHDCSWYQTCYLSNLLKGLVGTPDDYRSVRVKNVTLIAERIWRREGANAVLPPTTSRGVTAFTLS